MKQKTALFVVFALFVSAAGLFWFRSAQAVSQSSSQSVSVTVQATISLTLATTTIGLGGLTPGTPIFATTSAQVTTNSNTGWNLGLNRVNSTTTTLLSGSNTFSDYSPSWDDTAGSGNGNAVAAPGAVLSFRTYQTGTDAALFNSTWWGANDTGGTAKWGGTATTSKKIANVASYVSTSQNVVYGFRADAPGTQPTGSYSGSVTLTALTNP